MISITIDTEWCPDELIKDTVSLLDFYDVSSTLFSTHKDGVDAEGHERALHPNFLEDSGNESKILESIAVQYPEARGVRSHAMYIHSRLRSHYRQYDIVYESNYMQYLVNGVRPFWMLDGIIQFPVYFMDDMWFRSRKSPSELPNVTDLLSGDGLKVFDFHPIHVYLNTPSPDYYKTHKEIYNEPDALREARFDGPGVRELFVAILEEIERSGRETKSLGELASDFRASNDPSDIRI